jgi:hypothetical protein
MTGETQGVNGSDGFYAASIFYLIRDFLGTWKPSFERRFKSSLLCVPVFAGLLLRIKY